MSDIDFSPRPEGAQHTSPGHRPGESRYVVGIDLGTTNSAACYVDTQEESWRVRTFPVPQLVALHEVESRETLPSFHYQATPAEIGSGALRLPWSESNPDHTVGVFARDQGMVVPGRLAASAKSWLCHAGVDRTAALLPWNGAPDVERLSPVEVSSRYLEQIRRAWDHAHPGFPLAEQDVVITLPASFDEVARELTVRAAQQAGLPRVVLIEEPQAAFYAWINQHSDDWESLVSAGQKILVCDVGGGTSDFTLIRVRKGEGDKIQFHRVAVGDHLILGGDNLDLALAHHLERKLTGDGKLKPRQWDVLVRTCRHVKETLLGETPPESYTVNLPGSGSGLIGGGLQVAVTREEATRILVDGFLPVVELDAQPQPRKSGFQEFGLPYASDPAISRYLAAFLTAHRHVSVPTLAGEAEPATDYDPARPDIVLFNGGLFASPVLQARVLANLQHWFRTAEEPGWSPILLENPRLDLAVAQGAAYYGMVRRGVGVRIAAGLARTYYLGVGGGTSAVPSALCVVPAGVEPGQEIDLSSRQFDLLISEPVEFPLYVSSTRLTDRAGQVIPVDREQMTFLPPMRTVLKTRGQESGSVRVDLHARLTEIGTLDLWCAEVEGKRRWKLQFDVRSATQTDMAAHESAAEGEGILDEESRTEARQLLESVYARCGAEKPGALAKRLAKIFQLSRSEWPSSLLRSLWETLMDLESGRAKSADHEARWLNLLGFALRPGYGLAMDDWRVAETWKALQGRLVHSAPQCRAEWWILWRRIAGGLNRGQQQSLAEPLLGSIRQTHKQLTTGLGRGGGLTKDTHELAETWRLLGSLELLPLSEKIDLGHILLELLPKKKMEPVRQPMLWAVGRLGSREPLYGPLNAVVAAEVAEDWLGRLLELDLEDSLVPLAALAAMQLARRTQDRYRDIGQKLRERVTGWLNMNDAPAHFLTLVSEGGTLEKEERGLIFGEDLPPGLRL